MKKLAGLLLILFTIHASAQQVKLTAEHWDSKPNTVEFLTWKGVPSMKILSNEGQTVLKDLDFRDGTIEYDVEFTDPRFAAVYFRRTSDQENECFYFRTARAFKGKATDAVQYAPFIKGVNLWDMLPEYQSAALIEKEKWNHVKLVVSGKQLLAYVNSKLVLQIPQLEADSMHGGISFNGAVVISNLVVKPGKTERLSPVPGIDLTDNDPRYLRKWEVGQPFKAPDEGRSFKAGFLPEKGVTWDTVIAERRGLINLTRIFGESKEKRFVWLKTTIHSEKAQIRKLNMGFSDEVWVFINQRYLYADKNLYGSPGAKYPDGRCSLENTAFELPLNEGDNEVLIGLSNDFYGWGIIARLDRLEGLTIEE